MTEHKQEQPAKRPRREANSRDAVRPARRACGELADLLGRTPEGVVWLDRDDDGWRVGVEVVEIRRIPETADVMATYEVVADQDGRLLGYRRVHRYLRGAVDADR